MCTVAKERFESQLMIAGLTENAIDMEFGNRFCSDLKFGRNISVDTLMRLSEMLKCSSDYLTGKEFIPAREETPKFVELSSSRIKDRRTRVGFSQTMLANYLGVMSGSVICSYEASRSASYKAAHKNETQINYPTALALAYYLECSIDYLKGRTNTLGNPPALPKEIEEKQKSCMVRLSKAVAIQALKKTGRTPSDLAKKLGLPRKYYNRLIAGGMDFVPIHLIKMLEKTTQVSMQDLVIGKHELIDRHMEYLKTFNQNDVKLPEEEKPEEVKMSMTDRLIEANRVDNPEQIKDGLEKMRNIIEVSKQMDMNDDRVSLRTLGKVTKLAEAHPELLNLMDQIAELKPEQITHITSTIDVLVKGFIVS